MQARSHDPASAQIGVQKLTRLLQAACIPILLPALKEEMTHLKRADILTQEMAIEERELCGMYIMFPYSRANIRAWR